MPVFNNILAGSSGQATGYTIDQSLRFNDDDSAYLNRTAGTATSNDIGTFSFWTKRGNLGGGNSFFSNHSDANNRTYIGFDADTITMFGKISGSANVELLTTPVFRDSGAWYHIVIAVDVTQSTASNRVKIYVNGTQITDFGTATYPAQNTDLPLFSKTNHQVGAFFSSSIGDYYDGLLSEYHYIDGQALTPASFGESNSATNQWQAIEYEGSYGDNGFYQKYASTGGHTSFTSSGSWTAPTGVTSVDYLVVGGGGGGASASGGGGGGAGAFRSGTLSVTPGTTYSITVGAGGAGGSNSVGANGSDSVFSSITSNGGGGGGTSTGSANGNASGGGGGNGGSAGAGGTYGNAGGSGTESQIGGGGGGASAAGTAGVGSPYFGYGHGGAGSASSITGSSVTYSGGGGGGVGRSGAGGNGGSGGGGGGAATSQTPSNGTANTGGGGGGSNATSQAGGTGGSGIVVIKPAAGFGLGLDSSGNGNNFTANNLVATDQVLDSPSNNFCVLNPIDTNTSGTLSDGNLVTSGNARVTMQPESGQWYYEKDGSGVSVSGAFNPSLTSGTYNFGSSGTGGYSDGNGKGNFDNAVPSGYLAVCSDNLSASISDPTAYFNTVLYTGTGSTNAITGVGFATDMVWNKSRSATLEHHLFDTVRGATKYFSVAQADAEATDANSLTTFGSDGFTVGSSATDNQTSGTYVSWNWKAASSNTSVSAGSIDGTNPTIACTRRTNTTAGFSIVSYSGSGSAGDTVAHGLSQTPDLIIIKNRSAITNWVVNSPSIDSAFTKWALKLDLTEAISTDSTIWNNTAPNSTVFTLGTAGESNRNNPDNYIAYCFNSVEGYSKVDSYTGNGNADGTFVYTGFRPAFIFIKRVTSAGSNSYIVDNKRIGYNSFDTSTDNGSNKYLWPDSNAAEGNGTTAKGTGIDLVSNGFKFRGNSSDYNASGNDYLFYAIAESPFKTSNAR